MWRREDPLKRIQDEINEVARRERELREKTQKQQQEQNKLKQLENNNNNNNETNHHHSTMNGTYTNNIHNNNNSSNTNSLLSTISNDEASSTNSSLSPINGHIIKDTNLDNEHHSDDSGISASSSPIPTNVIKTTKYIRTNNYNVISPTPPPQKITLPTTRPIIKSLSKLNINNNIITNGNSSVTTPTAAAAQQPPPIIIKTPTTPNGTTIPPRPSLLHFTQARRVTTGPAHKGLMQRFINTRGKININNNGTNGYLGGSMSALNLTKDSPVSPLDQFQKPNRHSFYLSPSSVITPPIIERDSDGRPLRPGYIPVEEKIQKELKDLKTRETELKKIRRLKSMQSQPDLLESIDNEFVDSDEDSDVEHCYPPGKLRAAKSISELCDSMNSNSISPSRTTPSPSFDRPMNNHHHNNHNNNNHHNGQHNVLRPAVSLAQLCDLENDEDAPSSHQLIAKWESLIQQNS